METTVERKEWAEPARSCTGSAHPYDARSLSHLALSAVVYLARSIGETVGMVDAMLSLRLKNGLPMLASRTFHPLW